MWLLSCEWDITDRTFILCDRSIQDDATPIHSLCHVLGNIAKYRIPQACHLPCNLNWAPCDFWLFSKLEFQFFRNSVLSVTWKSLRYRRFGLSFCYLFRIGNLSRNVFWVTSPWTAYFFFLIIGHSGWSLLFSLCFLITIWFRQRTVKWIIYGKALPAVASQDWTHRMINTLINTLLAFMKLQTVQCIVWSGSLQTDIINMLQLMLTGKL